MNYGLRSLFAVACVALATGFGVRDARAGVIVSHASLQPLMSQVGDDCFTGQSVLAVATPVRSEREFGCSGLLSFDGTSDNPKRAKVVGWVDFSRDLSGGMCPSGESISVAGGGPNGVAIAEIEQVVDLDLLFVSLNSETRTRMQSGPRFRWFRPPRVMG